MFDSTTGNFLSIIELTFQVCSSGLYGNVCNIGWDDSDAAVVCRYQGYSPPSYGENVKQSVDCLHLHVHLFCYTVAEAFTANFTSSGTVAAQDVMCNGTEFSISECPRITSISSECFQQNRVAAARCIERKFQANDIVCCISIIVHGIPTRVETLF